MSWWKLWLARVLAVAGALVVPASSINPPRTAASQPPLVVGTNDVGPLPSAKARSKIPPITLTIHGEIVGLAPAAAAPTVTVRVGNLSIPASVDMRGYTAAIPWSDPSSMVSVTAVSGSVRLHGIVASMARLERMSGGDGDVSALDVPALDIDPWSTALSVLARVHLGGRDPASDAEYEQAQEQMIGADLGWIAFLLQRYTSGERALPVGFASGHDVALDPVALRREIEHYGTSGAWSWMTTDFALTTTPLAAFKASDPQPRVLQARYPGVLGQLPINSAIVTLVPDGVGRHEVYQRSSTIDPGFSSQWLLNGMLELKPDVPQWTTTYSTTHFSPTVPVRVHWRTDAIRWKRMTDGDEVDLWAFMRDWTVTYPDHPEQAPFYRTGFEVLSVRDFASLVRTAGWAGLEGTRRTLPTMCLKVVDSREVMETCDVAIHRFDHAGSGSTEDAGLKVDDRMQPRAGGAVQSFNWSRHPDGSLEVRYANGAVTRAWVTGGEPGLDMVVVRTTLTVNGVTHFANNGVLSIVPASTSFTQEHARGTWRPGMGEAHPVSYPVGVSVFQMLRDAGGVGEVIDADARFPQAWSVMEGRLYDVRMMARMPNSNGVPQYVTDCPTAFAQGAEVCSPTQVRYLRPLRRVGDRLYGIEEVHTQSTLKAQGDMTPFSGIAVSARASYQRCVAGECLAVPSHGASHPTATHASVPVRAQRATSRLSRDAVLRRR